MLEHALLLDLATHLRYELHIDILLHHYLVHPEDVCEERNHKDAHELVLEEFGPVDTHKNGGHVEENQEWAHELVKASLLEEDEEENLGEVSEHYLKNHVQVPVKFAVEPLFLLLNVPQFDQNSYL